MTQLRKFRDNVSNYFDEIERGIGKRGSSFMDVDAVSHDGDTGRFLFREFKIEGEPLHEAQEWVLRELARLPRCTVWLVRKRADGMIGWASIGADWKVPPEEPLTVRQYQHRLEWWWFHDRDAAQRSGKLTTSDIRR